MRDALTVIFEALVVLFFFAALVVLFFFAAVLFGIPLIAIGAGLM